MEDKEVGSDLADRCGLTPDVIPEASPEEPRRPGSYLLGERRSLETKQEVRRANRKSGEQRLIITLSCSCLLNARKYSPGTAPPSLTCGNHILLAQCGSVWIGQEPSFKASDLRTSLGKAACSCTFFKKAVCENNEIRVRN